MIEKGLSVSEFFLFVLFQLINRSVIFFYLVESVLKYISTKFS